MIYNLSLYDGDRVRLAPLEPARDAEIESSWTHNSEFLALTEIGPARPLSPAQIKKTYADDEKDKRSYVFGIRSRADDRLVGKVALRGVEMANGNAKLSIAIGKPEDRRQGLGSEALTLILYYAFNELNLFRITAVTFEYNVRAVPFFERAGFVVEARRREAIRRGGKRWDAIVLGLLRDRHIPTLVREPSLEISETRESRHP